MAAKKKQENTESIWNFGEGQEGPRPYAIQVVTAEFTPRTDRNGKIVDFGDTHLWGLNFEGPTVFLTEDMDGIDEVAETPDDRDYPVRSLTMGTFKEFTDEDENGETLTPLKGKGPRMYFDGGQALRSLVKLVGGDDPETGMAWLDENFGPWNVAESWQGHTIAFQVEYKRDSDGELILDKKEKPQTVTSIVGIDGVGVGTDQF